MAKTLRPHQSAAVQSIFDWFAQGRTDNPLIVAPVSAGKSLIMAELVKRIHADAPRVRIIMLAHVKELLEQNAAELHEHYSGADYGFYCAGLGQKRLHNDITFASIQSIGDKANRLNRAPDVIICDECHLIPFDQDTLYRRFIDDCLALNPNCKIIGLTGTPFRSGAGRLDEGEDRIFGGVCYQISMRYLIEQGFICKPVAPNMATRLSVDGVPISRGDYVAGKLEAAVDIDEKTKACVAEALSKAVGRRKLLVFTAGIEHCTHVRDEFRRMGESAEMITGKTPPAEREQIITDYRAGKFRVLVNVAVATTGFNVPDIDCLVFMRPTRSPVLYVQCVGRGIRVVYAPGHNLNTAEGRLAALAAGPKPDCLLLDFGGVVAELGPVDAIDVPSRKPKQAKAVDDTEQAPTPTFKRCPACGALCEPAQKYCFECSYSFSSVKLNIKASEKAVLSSDVPPEEYKVLGVKLYKHYKKEDQARMLEGEKPLNPATLKVSYATMAGTFNEWVCFEHHCYEQGDPRRFAWDKAVAWHKERIDFLRPPITIEEALVMGYQDVPVSHVVVKKEGKYDRIVKVVLRGVDDTLLPVELPQAAIQDAILAENGLNPDEIPF